MKRVNRRLLWISVIFGLLFGIVGEFIYSESWLGMENRILTMGIYILAFCIAISVVFYVFSSLRQVFVNKKRVISHLAFAIVLGVVLTCVLEFIYELNINIKEEPLEGVCYVFLIDDSGSMDSNDSENYRYVAVEEIINNLESDSEFAVYRFSTDVQCVTPLNSEEVGSYSFDDSVGADGGGTYMFNALNQIVEDMSVAQVNKYIKVVVLTDGQPSDNNWFKYNSFTKTCVKNNVAISSVGFGSSNMYLMGELADATGGTCYYASDIQDIASSLESVVNDSINILEVDRDLLGLRNDYQSTSIIYILMRVVFLSMIGVVLAFIKVTLLGEVNENQDSMMKLATFLNCLAAIICEVMFLVRIIPGGIIRVIVCVLWAITFVGDKDHYDGGSRSSNSYANNYGSSHNENNTKTKKHGNAKKVGETTKDKEGGSAKTFGN